MASFEKRLGKWRVRVFVKGERDSKTFHTKAEAAQWALRREAELEGRVARGHTVADALEKYRDSVSPLKRGHRWEELRLNALIETELGSIRIAELSPAHLAEWRDARLQEVSGATVAREMNLLRAVFKKARKEWQWMLGNPIAEVDTPTRPRARKRRITDDEIERMRFALGYPVDAEPTRPSQRVAVAFLFAIETGMRAGEITSLDWPAVHLKQRFVHLDKTKNGDERDVPLSGYAVKLLELLPRTEGPVFGLEPASRDALFRKARGNAKIHNLHFHDARAEAVWRLSKKLDVLQLARAIGHRDLKSLNSYYSESASEMAKLLD